MSLALALALAALGIYGVVSFPVGARTREIDVRVALGARFAGILGLVFRESLWMSAAGSALGIAMSLALTDSQLPRIAPPRLSPMWHRAASPHMKGRLRASQVARALVPTLARVAMHPRHDSREWTQRGPAQKIVAPCKDFRG